MGYALSFSASFFVGDGRISPEDMRPTATPTCVYQALISMSEDAWTALAEDVFAVSPDHLDLETVMRKIVETNTCLNLDPPVRVCIDLEGFHTVLVF